MGGVLARAMGNIGTPGRSAKLNEPKSMLSTTMSNEKATSTDTESPLTAAQAMTKVSWRALHPLAAYMFLLNACADRPNRACTRLWPPSSVEAVSTMLAQSDAELLSVPVSLQPNIDACMEAALKLAALESAFAAEQVDMTSVKLRPMPPGYSSAPSPPC